LLEASGQMYCSCISAIYFISLRFHRDERVRGHCEPVEGGAWKPHPLRVTSARSGHRDGYDPCAEEMSPRRWSGDHGPVEPAGNRRVVVDGPEPMAMVGGRLRAAVAGLDAVNGLQRLGTSWRRGSEKWRVRAPDRGASRLRRRRLRDLPSETTLNTASALLASGQLSQSPVILARAVGAVTANSALYGLARWGGRRWQSTVGLAAQNARVAAAMDLIGSRASVLLLFRPLRARPAVRSMRPVACPAVPPHSLVGRRG
jgi:hypothetical protein